MNLEPCPYCGLVADIEDQPALDTDGSPSVYCNICFMRGPSADRDGELWNRLPRSPAPTVGISDGELLARAHLIALPDWRDFIVVGFGDTKESTAQGNRFIEENIRQVVTELNRRAALRKGGVT